MLTAIDFDNEVCFGTKEIDDERANRLLPPEAESAELLVADARPESLLCISGI